MLAHAQDLKEWKYAFLIRVGPTTDEYGKPWTYCVTAVSNDGETAHMMGFKSDPDFTPAALTAAVRVLKALGYTKMVWERRNRPGGDKVVDASRKSGT